MEDEEDEVEDTHVRPATSRVRRAALAAVIMFMVSIFGFLLWLMKLGHRA